MSADAAPRITGRVRSAAEEDREAWFRAHIEVPPIEIGEFFSGGGVDLSGKKILDLGCGDGFISLGLARMWPDSIIVGADIIPVDETAILELSERFLGAGLPSNLDFAECDPTSLPFEDRTFDAVVTWSVFEHVSHPVEVLREIRRVLVDGGHLFIQIWPLYHSEHGSHLWHWFPDGFAHLKRPKGEIKAAVAADRSMSAEVINACFVDFDTLNHITLDGLQDALRVAGFRASRVELLSNPVIIPPGLEGIPLSDLMISGVKMIALQC